MTTLAATLESENITRPSGYTASARIVWNGGFWDGYSDAKSDRPMRTHKDHPGLAYALPSWSPFYCAGYETGHHAYQRLGFRGEDSSEQWRTFSTDYSPSYLRSMLKRELGYAANHKVARS